MISVIVVIIYWQMDCYRSSQSGQGRSFDTMLVYFITFYVIGHLSPNVIKGEQSSKAGETILLAISSFLSLRGSYLVWRQERLKISRVASSNLHPFPPSFPTGRTNACADRGLYSSNKLNCFLHEYVRDEYPSTISILPYT